MKTNQVPCPRCQRLHFHPTDPCLGCILAANGHPELGFAGYIRCHPSEMWHVPSFEQWLPKVPRLNIDESNRLKNTIIIAVNKLRTSLQSTSPEWLNLCKGPRQNVPRCSTSRDAKAHIHHLIKVNELFILNGVLQCAVCAQPLALDQPVVDCSMPVHIEHSSGRRQRWLFYKTAREAGCAWALCDQCNVRKFVEESSGANFIRWWQRGARRFVPVDPYPARAEWKGPAHRYELIPDLLGRDMGRNSKVNQVEVRTEMLDVFRTQALRVAKTCLHNSVRIELRVDDAARSLNLNCPACPSLGRLLGHFIAKNVPRPCGKKTARRYQYLGNKFLLTE